MSKVLTSKAFKSADEAAIYAKAGKATITLNSLRTGTRYTFKVQRPKSDRTGEFFFVSLLTGPDNTADFTYIGILKFNEFQTTPKSRMTPDSQPVKAFMYFSEKVLKQRRLPVEMEVRHEGRCGRCSRKLTVPKSIDNGIGPECANKMAF